ncbi:MAG TPA: hypothetical protein DCS55_08460 [Acidimicrobiaceae bacterium]|nr:hypothetical protein [Acidimicrobiaceae bacterium]
MSLSLLAAATVLAAACGGDGALPSVPESAVPDGDPTVGAEAPVTLAGENCLRAEGLTLVFVDGQAEMSDVGQERRLELRSTTDDGGEGLMSVPVEGPTGFPVLGHEVEPAEWSHEPPEGCEGPYFLVTGFDIRTG